MSEIFDPAQLQQLNQQFSRMLTDFPWGRGGASVLRTDPHGFRWPGSPQPADIPAQNYAKALRIAIKQPQTPAYLGLALLPPGRQPLTRPHVVKRQMPEFPSPLTPWRPVVLS